MATLRIGSSRRPPVSVHALLDSCSELTLISSEIARRLRAPLEEADIEVTGVGGNIIQRSTRTAQLQLHLPDRQCYVEFVATCVPRLGIITPTSPLDEHEISSWQAKQLADPQFGTPKTIELLIGADLLSELMRPGSIHEGGFMAQNTAVGWAISGRSSKKRSATGNGCLSTMSDTLDSSWQKQLADMLQRFWEMEDVPPVERKSAAHAACEKLFAEHQRTENGKYVVRLPLLDRGAEQLGESEFNARASLTSLHRRMSRDQRFADEYRKFMEEYLRLGHMRPIPEQQLQADRAKSYYIPHHGIWQRSDKGDKLRVVFNASRPTSSGKSLNDMLHPGPKLQTDIWLVLTRWRMYRVAFCADIQMMFRQIWIDERDVDFQRILWSPSPEEPALHCQLLTQLCADRSEDFPEAAAAATKDRYVDDILSGADTVEDARRLRDQLIQLMASGRFPLRKWVANKPELLQDLEASHCLRSSWILFTSDDHVRELGVTWNPQEDMLGVGCPALSADQRSKRKILAALASIFDPCGWLAPATLCIKLLLQDLWRARLDWDDEIPTSMRNRWDAICRDAPAYAEVSIPRWISTRPMPNDTRIHAFADASRRAIAAVLYSRTPVTGATNSVNFLVAKTKLAPIRSLRPASKPLPRMTIPRLELRAALIAARLLRRICDELGIPIESCTVWLDSQIARFWVLSQEPTGNSVVDSYVHQIQELTPPGIWRYVPSEQNPADVASRGCSARQLLNDGSWFPGPKWLAACSSQWPIDQSMNHLPNFDEPARVVLATLAEKRGAARHAAYLSVFSDLGRLLTFLVRLRRWVRSRLARHLTLKVLEPLTPSELDIAFEACIRASQRSMFGDEIKSSEQQGQKEKPEPLPGKGPLRTLNPFVCSEGILRVGGRLEHSALPFNQRHPPILDASCDLARLIIAWAHTRSLHGGFRSTYSYTLHRAWLIGGKRQVRRFIHNCVICTRSRAAPLSQLMAPLPSARVTPSRAFASTGLDYAGPFQVLPAKGRGVRTTKAYVAVFVCMASKAIHLELVGDLSTESLLGALERFCVKRGLPAEIWSDNATNFHRADVEMREALNQESLHWDEIKNELAKEGVSWKFIPPAAPHFGGLWEAAVKSFKTHLKKVMGSKHLTFEEFTTLLAGIELVLNCRPLGPISGDLDDLAACTPGHLLIGTSLRAIPQVPVDVERVDHLQHWKLVQGLRAKFWQQWSREYLNTLQQRHKWIRRRDNVQVGDLVLILDASLLRPNGRWPLGRIIEVHPGRDGLMRTATVKTEFGVYVRPIVKLTALPVSENLPAEATSAPASSTRSRRAAAAARGRQGGRRPTSSQ